MSHTNAVELVENGGWDERILVCRNGDLVDTTIIISERFVVVVDTMINETTGEALYAIAQPYVDDGRSLLVVNTHADYDHSWGNQVFAAKGVPIIGRRNSVPIFSEEGSRDFLQRVQADEPDIFAGVHPTPPNILLDDALTIEGGDLTLELFATPGHTVDHLSLYIPEIRTLLAADAAEIPYPMARTPEGLPAMRRSLAKLAAMDADIVLYCHAQGTTDGQVLRHNITYFDRLEAACRDALANGVPYMARANADIIELVGLPYQAAAPDSPSWQDVHEFYQTSGHAQQLRHMLASLAPGTRLSSGQI